MTEPARIPPGELSGDGVSAFLRGISRNSRKAGVAEMFHAVRQLPYLSTGDRSLEGILARRAGSCSSKHILLAELLNRSGVAAEVHLVLGDFATPLRDARNLPARLLEMAAGGIRDVHNVVRIFAGGKPVILDATWHDAMIPFGFRVNHAWDGIGDTQIAVDPFEFLGTAPDPAAAKARIIGAWPSAEQERRRAFLELINAWVAELSTPASRPANQ